MTTEWEWIEVYGCSVKLEPDAGGRYTIYSLAGMKKLLPEEINPLIWGEIQKHTKGGSDNV